MEHDLGHFEAARELHVQAIGINEKVYKADHPMLAVSYFNLATVEQVLGQFEAARRLMRQAFEI